MLLTLLSNQKPATVTLYPPLVANTSQFYAATVTPGTVTLQPTLLVNTNVFYSATVSSTVTLQPARFNNTNTFYRPKVTQSADVLVGGGGGEVRFWTKVIPSLSITIVAIINMTSGRSRNTLFATITATWHYVHHA